MTNIYTIWDLINLKDFIINLIQSEKLNQMQNTTSEQILLKLQGSSTSLFTLAAANNTMIKTNAVQFKSF